MMATYIRYLATIPQFLTFNKNNKVKQVTLKSSEIQALDIFRI